MNLLAPWDSFPVASAIHDFAAHFTLIHSSLFYFFFSFFDVHFVAVIMRNPKANSRGIYLSGELSGRNHEKKRFNVLWCFINISFSDA